MTRTIDPAIAAKRAAETALVERIGAKVYNRQLLASCGHHVDDETALARARPTLGTVRLVLEEIGLIWRQETPEPSRVLTSAEMTQMLKDRKAQKAPS